MKLFNKGTLLALKSYKGHCVRDESEIKIIYEKIDDEAWGMWRMRVDHVVRHNEEAYKKDGTLIWEKINLEDDKKPMMKFPDMQIIGKSMRHFFIYETADIELGRKWKSKSGEVVTVTGKTGNSVEILSQRKKKSEGVNSYSFISVNDFRKGYSRLD